MNKRILGIDFGTKLIGIAITDDKNKFSIPYLVEKNDIYFINKLKEIINDENIGLIVLGYPKTENNYISERHKLINDFFSLLKKNFININIVLQDESYTTINAMKIQKDFGMKNSKIKKTKDMNSAALILDQYLYNVSKNKNTKFN